MTLLDLGDNRLNGCLPINLQDQLEVADSDLGGLLFCCGAPPGPANLPPAQTSAETDKDALLAIFDATDGDSWDESGTWAGRKPIGEWAGVTTDEDGRVVGLDVNLGGAEIPPEVGHLTGLTTLTLSGVSGALPPELGYLVNLTELDLSYNRLCGEIPPELGGLGSLQSLNLGGNQLTGRIPSELDNLVSSLSEIWLDGNRLECISDLLRGGAGYAGEIPVCTTEDHPGDTEALIALYNAWGEPDNLANWLSREPISEWEGVTVDVNGRVVALNLQGKGLTGEIPVELGNLTSLETLNLFDNYLTGEIPAELGSFTSLRVLSLSDIRLAEEVLRNWANLDSVRVRVGGANIWVGAKFASVSAGRYYACRVRTDGSVTCWGADDEGQSTPSEGEWASVSAGWNHTCGVRTDGSVACWGADDEGKAMPSEGEWASVSAGEDYRACGVRTDGSVACWGNAIRGTAPWSSEGS